MNTKLNINVIEDKSITYSKLADDVTESITATMTGSAPDWNAQEGEPGYIENKPFGLYGKCEYTLGNGVKKIEVSPNIRFMHFENKIIELPEFKDGIEFTIMSRPTASIKYSYSYDGHAYLELTDYANYFSKTTIEFYSNMKLINPSYIPVDWNASENESGYIKNKTHYDIIVDNTKFYVTDNDIEYEEDDEGNLRKLFLQDGNYASKRYFDSDILIVEGEGYYKDRQYILHKDDSIEVVLGISTYILYWDEVGFWISLLTSDEEDYETFENHWSNFKYYFKNFKQLDEKFIPDTIARKSEVQDIDPVVWKYLCNPLVISVGDTVPEELLGSKYIYGDNTYYKIKYPNRAMYKYKYTSVSEDDSGYVLMDLNTINNQEISIDQYILNSEWVGISICIDEDKRGIEL